MNYNRLTAALLTATLAASLVIPVGAATSSFSDITDQDTAIHADVLRLMGVVDGVGSNQFNPQGTLTRGAFCKMLVTYMGLEDKLPLYETRTIFRDVPASHWAAPYINLAASTASGEEGMLIAGVGDGSFQPDSIITYAQAVTILVRVLGYADSDTGAIWPLGYLNLAASIGLTQGLSLEPGSDLTRSQAAQLFVQALSSDTKSGVTYYEGMGGSVTEDVMVLATNVDSDNGTEGAIRTSVGTYLPEIDGVNPISLQGRRGTLVVSDKQEMVVFLPDDSISTAVTLSEGAQATYLVTTGGARYSIHSDTPVFTYGDTSGEEVYSEKWTDLASGARLTLFLEKNTVIAIYVGDTAQAEEAIVVTGTPTRSTFYAITGGRTDFTILRNGQEISVGKIVADDVVTYDATTNCLQVSDLRISAVYESGSPNSTTPTSVHVLGHDFPVLDGALAQSDNVKVGDTVAFLLTADGSVAAMKKTSTSRRSTAYGIAGESSVEVFLPAGGTITLSGSNTLSTNLQNRLVTVSSHQSNRITASTMNAGTAGTFDVGAMTLGGRTIAPHFGLFEQLPNGAVIPLTLSALDMEEISSGDIATFRLDGSGHVDIIVLDGVTGDGYTYGKLVEIPKEDTTGSMSTSNRMVSVENSGNGTAPAISNLVTGLPFANGAFGGVTQGREGTASSVIVLEAIEDVSRSDFFTADGKTYVKVGGTSYQVSSQVECYNGDSKSWTTLSAIRAYSDQLTIYIDPLGSTVRVITGVE